jgi:hypothetical protein
MSPCHHVSMSSMSPCLKASCLHVSMSLCLHVSMSPCLHVSKSLCLRVSVSPCLYSLCLNSRKKVSDHSRASKRYLPSWHRLNVMKKWAQTISYEVRLAIIFLFYIVISANIDFYFLRATKKFFPLLVIFIPLVGMWLISSRFNLL